MRLLVAGGVDKDVASSALMLAVRAGHLDMARLLVEAGANKDVTDSDAALTLALREGHVGIARLLAGAGGEGRG